jgi:hypothetical protein
MVDEERIIGHSAMLRESGFAICGPIDRIASTSQGALCEADLPSIVVNNEDA